MDDTEQPIEENEDVLSSRNVIWGTNISTEEVLEKLGGFLDNYTTEDHVSLYVEKLTDVKELGERYVDVDLQHVNQFDHGLFLQIVSYPTEMLPLFELAVSDRLKLLPGDFLTSDHVQVRVFNVGPERAMRDVGPNDIDRLVPIHGMITRVSSVFPELKIAFFECGICRENISLPVVRSRVTEPHRCPKCNTLQSMQIIHNRSSYGNKQIIRLQESPENIPEGETPHSITCVAFDELVDVGKPGDRVTITGILNAEGVRLNPRMRTLKSIFSVYLVVNHCEQTKSGSVANVEATAEDGNSSLSTERVEEIRALAGRPNIVEMLVKSFAPSIFGLDDIKKGLLCQLFGGSRKKFTQSGSGRFRPEINCLLVGDPSTSKSQFLSYVHKLSARGIYTSGKGSSAVGLTASVIRDTETRDSILESGALVLSDRGICCIDEFDKMSDSARAALHEAMEQQTISIAKAGIVCTLNARTAILAAANPKESKYNPRMSVVDNIQLPPTLLSRFDLIYLMLDRPNRELDSKLALHLASMYGSDFDPRSVEVGSVLDGPLLADYISFARAKINPSLSEEACINLVNSYKEMRSRGRSSKKTVSATPRQLESLIRLSEALAKMRLSDSVSSDDVKEAHELIDAALRQVATDSLTGLIDFDLILTGHSAAEQANVRRLRDALENIFRRNPGGRYSLSSLTTMLLGQDTSLSWVSSSDIWKALDPEKRSRVVRSDHNKK